MKKLISSLVIVILTLTALMGVTSYAAETAVFKTSAVQTAQDETFTTTLYLEEGSNLIDFQMQIKYDTDIVTLISAEENENMKGTMEITPKENGVIHLSYTKTSSNLTEKSDLVDLTFKVDENAGMGLYDIISLDESYAVEAHTMVGSDLKLLNTSTEFAKLNIFKAGDVNLDGGVSIADVTFLRQHLASIRTLTDYQLKFADAYFDNNISISDAVRIQQNLANEDILLGNRVNITFYDKDGNVQVIKSVKYGSDLTNIPQNIKYTGFTWLGWSSKASELVEVNFANLTKDMSVYGIYYQDASPAVTFYKERLRMTYYTTNTLSSNLSLISDITYQDGYTAKITWSSSNGVTLNATSGEFFMPLYDNTLSLTAHIVSYKDGTIEAEDDITFNYHVIGRYQCPTKDEIKSYLNSIFDDKIETNLVLPKKITNEDVENANSQYEVRVSWAILGDDNSEIGINQIARSAYEQNITLVANITFNGEPIGGDGKIYFDNIILSPITEKEVSDHIIEQISSNMGLSVSTSEFLWNNDDKYDANVRWISKNSRIASIANNQITIKSTAVNGEALPLVAEVTYPTGEGAVTFELSYTVSVVAENKLLVPGTNIDENLYDALKTATGVYGNLTTDALKDITFVYLDLSDYPEIKDLSGLTYCSNLRVLNISGLKIEKGLNEIASLSQLESLIARDCGFDDSSLTDGGIPILKNMIYLKMLDLSYNNLTTLNSVFGEGIRYGRLQELYLGHNQLDDISAIDNAPLLQFLLLENNNLDSDDLENFSKFKVLKLLSIANNNIDSLANLTNNRTLLELRAQGNNISNIKDLRFMTHLQSLYLGDNNLSNIYAGQTESNISYLKYLPELQILYLNNNNIEELTNLNTLSKLKSLNVSNNKIQTLSNLYNSGNTLVELYAENNDLQSFGFLNSLPMLRKLMLSGNSSVYESTLSGYLSKLTELETLTLSGKELRDVDFLEKMPKLVRLDIAGCSLAENGEESDIQNIADLSSTLRYLDVSNNGFEDISPLQQLSNLIVFYSDNVNGSVNAPELFALMSEIQYVSMENCGIEDIGWLSKFKHLVYANFAGNNLSSFDLGNNIAERSRGSLKYLYIDSRTPFAFINSYNEFDGNVLEELSMENVQLDAMDYIPDMKNLKYLNISNSNITDLEGSDPSVYEMYSIAGLDTSKEYRFINLETIDVTGVQADITALNELPNLKKVYGVGIPSEKAFYESNITALYDLYNKGVECYLYDYDTPYEPIASVEGEKILGELEDISCDITVAADNIISDNNPLLVSEINDFDITWSVSNSNNYAVIDNHIAVVDYTNIADEELIVTAEISVYPGQSTVTRDFVINTHILRVDDIYLDTDATGAGEALSRGAEFTYNVQTKSSTTEGFTSEVAPVYDDIAYSYSVTLQSGDIVPTENVLLTENAPQYQIHPETEALEAVVTITVEIGHNELSGWVVDKTIIKNITIKTRTFNMNFVANGGTVVSISDGAPVTSRPYFEDSAIFEDIEVSKEGYTFGGWYSDEGLTEEFTRTTMPMEHTTVYAKWNINSYTVSFVSNEGSAIEPMEIEFNSTVPVPEEPTRPIHLFQGWFKDEALTIPWDFNTDVIKGDTTLYAKWLLNEYTVTFNANGGSSTSSKKFVYGSTVEFPTVTRDYYTFKGWYKDSSCTSAWNNSDTVTQDLTLYAKWEQNPIVGWVKASALPSGAQVTEREWRYTLREYSESSSSSKSGWTHYETKRTGWTAWSGWLTYDPSNGVRNVQKENHYYKTQYHYYRYYNGYGMYTYPYNSTYKKEEAYFDWILGNAPGYTDVKSTNGSKDQSTWWCQANLNYAHNFTGKCFEHPCYRDEWRYQDPIYTYYFYRDLSKTSSSKPTDSNIVGTPQEYVKYRAK